MTRRGFLPTALTAGNAPPSLFPACGECGLFRSCHSPKMALSGEGKRGILVVGEAPGEQEDLQGRPFVGPSGELLSRVLSRHGVDLRSDCWIYNAALCRPPRNKLPPKAVEHCRPNVVRVIRETNPSTILLLGGSAVESVIKWLWPNDSGGYGIGRWFGWQIPSQQLNAWVCPAWHPAYVLRNDYGPSGKDRAGGNDVRELLFERHVAAAIALPGRPWPDGPPDFARQVRVEYDDRKAAEAVRRFAASARPVAFDYETGYKLKPDWPDSFIRCCSLSDGEETIAFPWHGKAVAAMREFVRSDVPKVAANLKHEHRWTQAILGLPVRNWHWDTVLAAHVLDNRSSVSGLKFQSFVHLGQPRYSGDVEQYLRSGPDGRNRVKDAPLDRLLLYCGMDSLLEAKLAVIQRRLIEEGN